MTLPFTGELMTCICCDRSERSDPSAQSQWRCIVADGVSYYACPAEFPPDSSSQVAFELAYTRVLSRIMELRCKGRQQS